MKNIETPSKSIDSLLLNPEQLEEIYNLIEQNKSSAKKTQPIDLTETENPANKNCAKSSLNEDFENINKILCEDDLRKINSNVDKELDELMKIIGDGKQQVKEVIDLTSDEPVVLLGHKRNRIDDFGQIYPKIITSNDIQAIVKSDPKHFTVMNYNILSQNFIKKKSREDLSLDNRMKKILKEIEELNPDIICLQEASVDVLKKYINKLEAYLFSYGSNKDSAFINIIGYKSNRFSLIKNNNFSFDNKDVDGNRGIYSLILEDNLSNKRLVVYNIHFPWKPKYEFHRCQMLSEVYEDIQNNRYKNVILAGDFNSHPDSLPLKLIYKKYFELELEIKRIIKSSFLFNTSSNNLNISDNIINYDYQQNSSTPRNITKSEILNQVNLSKKNYYQNIIYSKKKAVGNINEQEFNRFSDDVFLTEEEVTQFLKDSANGINFQIFRKVDKELAVKSAYEDYKNLLVNKISYLDGNSHPDFTIYTANYKQTIDYIFYSSKSLEVLKILKLPEKSQLDSEGFLPSANFPSDHLKLFSEFRYK
jgi:mRNA deadenylase 3'-5' endonuclease subunit Ccr4